MLSSIWTPLKATEKSTNAESFSTFGFGGAYGHNATDVGVFREIKNGTLGFAINLIAIKSILEEPLNGPSTNN